MKLSPLLSALLLVALNSCSPSLHVYSDYDKEADIANYKNYKWLSQQAIEARGLNPIYYNELNDKRIKKAIDNQLQAKGFLLNNSTQQLEMHYHIILDNKTMVIPEPSGYNYNSGWQTEPKIKTVYPYQEGTLIIDLMDCKNKTLVWRGWAQGTIEAEVTKDPEKAIEKAVKKIFKLFPYRRL